jgi:hypothetical protein
MRHEALTKMKKQGRNDRTGKPGVTQVPKARGR